MQKQSFVVDRSGNFPLENEYKPLTNIDVNIENFVKSENLTLIQRQRRMLRVNQACLDTIWLQLIFTEFQQRFRNRQQLKFSRRYGARSCC